jgi:DNA end-binding protein Ku
MPDESVTTTDKELAIAQQLIDSLAGPFEPDKYHDTYRQEVLDLIERKAAGEEIAIQPPAEEPRLQAADLMSALQASLDEVRKRTGEEGAAAPPRKRAAARTASNGGAKTGSRATAKTPARGGRKPAKKS